MKKNDPKTTSAAALKYDGENAPKLVAKASGILAEKIIEKAKQHDIHIHNDPILLSVLSRLELGDEIPKNLYLAVAKIIAFAYYLQGKCPASKNNNQSQTNDESASAPTKLVCSDNKNVNHKFYSKTDEL